MGDVKVELDELRQSASDPALDSLRHTQAAAAGQLDSAPKRIKRKNLLVWIIAAIFLTAIPLAWAYFRRQTPEPRSHKLSVLLPENASLESHAISPDGNQLGFVATVGDNTQIWLRPFDSLNPRPLAGTEGAETIFWSPDARAIGFFTKDKLKRITLSSGVVTALCNVAEARGGAWGGDGEIVFAPRIADGLYRISANGGKPVPVTTLDRSQREDAHRWPWFLPDGRHFLYYVRSSQRDQQGTYVGSLDSKEKKRLVAAIGGAAYAAPGYLLFVLNQRLVAQPFDPDRLQITGEPVTVVEEVAQGPGWFALFSISANVLTYKGGTNINTQLAWFDRAGKQLQAVATPSNYGIVRLSPDGTLLAGHRVDPETAGGDIWLVELLRGTRRRFTTDPSYEYVPIWSPDGARIVFSSNREGSMDLYVKSLSGPDESEALLKSDTAKYPEDWSLDGRFILYSNFDSKTGQYDLWYLPWFGDRRPAPFLTTPFAESQGQFSPDGRWVAYCSDESGENEVYVQSFPVPGNKVLISTGGGTAPKWRRDGKELFYLAADGKFMALEVQAGATLKASIPQALPFNAKKKAAIYDIAADGQRFLINTATENTASGTINVVLNWTAELRKTR